MKRTKKDKILFATFAALAILIFVSCIYLNVRFFRIESYQEELNARISVCETYGNSWLFGYELDTQENNSLLDQTSVMLSMVSVAIAIFTVFGGLLSYVNIQKSKELSDAIYDARSFVESQKELIAARYLQEGRAYLIKNRRAFAKECFQQALDVAEPGSLTALLIEFDLHSLYTDVVAIEKIPETEFETMQSKFKNLLYSANYTRENNSNIKRLKGDIHFLLGCLYGTRAKNVSDESRYIHDSISELIEAIKCDRGNADYHRSASLSYALIGDVKKCKYHLDVANDCAQAEPLYLDLIDKGRLADFYNPEAYRLSDEVKTMLSNDFQIEIQTAVPH